MKKIGITIILVGLILSFFIGSNYVTKNRVVDMGTIELINDENNDVDWSPLLGMAVMILGGMAVNYAKRNSHAI